MPCPPRCLVGICRGVPFWISINSGMRASSLSRLYNSAKCMLAPSGRLLIPFVLSPNQRRIPNRCPQRTLSRRLRNPQLIFFTGKVRSPRKQRLIRPGPCGERHRVNSRCCGLPNLQIIRRRSFYTTTMVKTTERRKQYMLKQALIDPRAVMNLIPRTLPIAAGCQNMLIPPCASRAGETKSPQFSTTILLNLRLRESQAL